MYMYKHIRHLHTYINSDLCKIKSSGWLVAF